MRIRKNFIWSLVLLIAPLTVSSQTTEPLVVRVGVISYEDFGRTFEDYGKNVFSPLMESKAGGRPVVFRVAVGTYGDVLDWYNRNLIDLALLTPEPVAELMSTVAGANQLRNLYIATRATTPMKGTPEYRYNSTCIVNNNSPLHNFEELKEWARMGRIQFMFVHPLSVSGSILPRYLLSVNGITNLDAGAIGRKESAPQNSIVWTFGHEESLNGLGRAEIDLDVNDPVSRIPVAFVSRRELNGRGRVLPFPQLDDQMIPQEVVLISKKFIGYKQILKDLFIKGSPEGAFAEVDGWMNDFENVKKWVKDVGVSSHDVAAQKISLSQIGDNLRNFEFRYHRPARLALVLSGGGAKCSYQLGAIEALETELEGAPVKDGEKKVDIDLVVGTSGGAINALCVALGLTRDEGNQREKLEQTWESFDQRQFFRPWSLAGFLLGVVIGLFQAFLVLRLAVFFTARRVLKASIAILSFALLDFILVFLAWNPPWKLLGDVGKMHILHHLWVVSTLSLDISACVLLVFGMALLILRLKLPDVEKQFKSLRHAAQTAVVCSVAALIVACLFIESTLSKSEGVEKSLAQRIPALLNIRPDSSLQISSSAKTPLQQISDEILDGNLLKRDLVITGSRLSVDSGLAAKPTAGDALPDDLYFYYDHKGAGAATECERKNDPELPVDTRFVPFGSSLLDVVIGSSSIYPFFPSRSLSEVQPNLEIIDGGFAHNSPTEAAVLWGATHIILIEASAEASPTHGNFVDNVVAAFNHLYVQAQLVDAHSRGKVEIYTLRPTQTLPGEIPNLCVFDFSDILIQKAIADGRRDAFDDSHPHFRRESGEPNFREIVSSNGCNDGLTARNQKDERSIPIAKKTVRYYSRLGYEPVQPSTRR